MNEKNEQDIFKDLIDSIHVEDNADLERQEPVQVQYSAQPARSSESSPEGCAFRSFEKCARSPKSSGAAY